MIVCGVSDIHCLLAFLIPGHYEWIILLVLGLLIFGRRLPEVGRSLGRGIVEFKRGIKGIDDEIETESAQPAPPPEPRIAHEPAQSLPNAPAPEPPSVAVSSPPQQVKAAPTPAAPGSPGIPGTPASGEAERPSG